MKPTFRIYPTGVWSLHRIPGCLPILLGPYPTLDAAWRARFGDPACPRT